MKRISAVIGFIIAYAAFLGLGLECLLQLLGSAMAISIDGPEQYPVFLPFCFIVGLLALAAIAVLLILNIKVSERLDYTKRVWGVQIISAVIISVPMIKLWEILFDILQKVF